MSPSVAAVIPTVGRVDPGPAIRSVLAQTVPIDEIIVVDGSARGVDHGVLPRHDSIEVVRRDPSRMATTASANRNAGVATSSCDLVAFLDDDDEWVPDKTAHQLEAFSRYGRDIVVSGSVRHRLRGRVARRRPRRQLPRGTPSLHARYGSPSVLPSSFYVATPTLMLTRELARSVPMDESRRVYEDPWWLYQLELAGATVIQLEAIVAICNATPIRSLSRATVDDELEWAHTLERVRPGLGRNFLIGMASRNAAVLGRKSDLRQFEQVIDRWGPLGPSDRMRRLAMRGLVHVGSARSLVRR